MNSLPDIWHTIENALRAKLTDTAIITWFSECSPVELKETRLVIYTPSKFKRDIIEQRYGKIITDALYDLFSIRFDLTVLAEDELDEYRRERESERGMCVDNNLPEIAGFTFDHFVVGGSNKYAFAAAQAVARSPGSAYNPLFIYGNSGLGKTHLLLAIGQYIYERNHQARISYVKGDQFANDMINSIREKTTEEFRLRYRRADLFLVDDIQFIAGKTGVQEEFFHTFNTIFEAGHQIVITSDRPPLEIKTLEDRLRSRFEGGLMADVQPPDMETRMAITRNKASHLGMLLPDDVVEFISENITANIRQIEGVVNRLTAYRDILNDTISIDSAKRAIKDVIRIGTYIPTPDIIIEESARYYSLTSDDLRGQRRSKNTAMARQISMYLMRSFTNLSLKDIGEQYEDRNHSTVLSSIKKIEELLKADKNTADIVRDISSNINSRN
ncbi:MAG: chromosomal replication initiator protein DnaA [Firmicutes bacterium]|nr:chromosomal replication initiator protein DnaA [Bacillota bacterium]